MTRNFYPRIVIEGGITMRWILFLLLTACSGCGQESNDSPSAPDKFNFVGASGTRVSFDTDVVSTDPAQFEIRFIGVQECMLNEGYISSSVQGPVVRVVSFQPMGFDGWTDYTTGQITLDGIGVMEHESVHYILYKSSLPTGHEHPAFKTCVNTIKGWITDAVPLSLNMENQRRLQR